MKTKKFTIGLASFSLAAVIITAGGLASSASATGVDPGIEDDLSGTIYVIGDRAYNSEYQSLGTVQDLISEASSIEGSESFTRDLMKNEAAIESGSIYENEDLLDSSLDGNSEVNSKSGAESPSAAAAPARKAPGCENAGAKFPFHKFGRAAFGSIAAGVTKALCGEYNSKGWNHAWYDHSEEYRTMSFASGGPADDHNTSEFMLMAIGSAVEFPINAWYESGNNCNIYVTPVEIYKNMELWGSFNQKVLVGNQNEELITAYIM